jgi:transcriptional regulator with XRE-family HTH domain
MAIANTLHPAPSSSPLAALRVKRQLPLREVADRTGLSEAEIAWLEEGRVYMFRTADDALVAVLLYATALGVDQNEARELAGLPVAPRPLRANPAARLGVLGAIAAALIALAAALVLPGRSDDRAAALASRARAEALLPPPWRIDVDVLNGSGDINNTRRVATRIGAMAYRIHRVARAGRFDYPQTVVFFEPGGEANAVRLARQLGVVSKPLPGGDDPNRLVVVVGPRKGPG